MDTKKLMCKATEIYLLLFASIHLLYIGFSGYSHIFEAKVLTFCVINILYLLSLIILFLISADRKDTNPFESFKKHLFPARFFAILYMLFALISGALNSPVTFFGVSRFEGVFTISLYCLSFVAVSLFPCKKRYLTVVFSISVSLSFALSALQLMGYNPLSLYPDGMTFYDAGIKYTTAFTSTIGNTNLVGAFICLALPFLTAILLKSKGWLRFLLFIPILLMANTVLRMGVDSAILGLLAGIIIGIPFIFRFRKKHVIIYISAIIILAILGMIFIYNYSFDSGFLFEIREILHGRISDTFGSGRIRIWKNVLSEIPDSPIFGKGPDTMQLEKFPSFERYYPALGKVMKTGIDVAHNELLNVLYHQGIIGLISYLGFIFFVLRDWWKNRNDTVVLSLGISLICYLVQSMFTFSMCLVAPYFWIAAGRVVGISRENIKEPTLD